MMDEIKLFEVGRNYKNALRIIIRRDDAIIFKGD